MDRFDPFVKYADVYGDIINWEKDPMNKPQNQNKYFFSDGKTYYEQICKMLRLMSVFKEAFNQIYSNEDEISEAWENFVNNLSASVVEGSEPDVTLTWTDDSVNFEFTMVPGVPGEQGVGITSISFNSDYTMTITLSDGNTYTSMSLKGETGPQGPQGETGSGLQILDVYATLADLQSAHPTGQPGDAYQVGSAGNYILYIWSSSQSEWVTAGSLGTVSPSLSNPLMDGTASAGSLDQYSRGDHVHPTDTSRASKEELDALIKTSQALIDQSFTYRKSPAIQDGLARFDKIKGNTLVWNQLVQNGNFESTSGWNFNNPSSASVSSNTLTVSANADASMAFPLSRSMVSTQGHKYLIMCDVQCSQANQVRVRYPFVSTAKSISANTWTRFAEIGTATDGQTLVGIQENGINGATYNYKNFVCFDLTQMGLDITDPSEFTSLFPLSYYTYTTGTLLDFKGTGIKTVGKNLFNESDFSYRSDKILNDNGVETPFGGMNYTLDYIEVLSDTLYVSGVFVDPSHACRFYFYDSGKNWISRSDGYTLTGQKATLRLPQNTRYIRFQYVPSVLSNIMIADEDFDDYEAYVTSTTNLPISTYFTSGMKSAGNVYDELTPTKAVTRIGAVDLGSLTWTKVGAISMFYAPYNTDGIFHSGNDLPNIKTSIYSVCSATTMYNNRNGIVTDDVITVNAPFLSSTEQRIIIADTSYTDANALKTALSGVYLYYELATPTETDADLDLSFNAYENGTEQLLPVNGSVPSTSPIIADMNYLSIDDAMEYILDKLANVPQNTQQILESLGDDVSDLQTDTGALQTAVSGLQTSVGNINSNIGQISSTVAGHTDSISDMQSDITDLNTDLGDLSDTVTDHTSRIGTLESGLSTTNGNVQNLETSVSGLDSTVTAQGETVTALDNFVSNIANTRNPGYMSSDNSIGITSAFLNMRLAAGQSTWANIPLPTIMAGFIPLFVVGASTGDGSVCLFKIPSTYNQNNIYRVGVKNTSNSEVTTQVGIEILCIKQRQSQ